MVELLFDDVNNYLHYQTSRIFVMLNSKQCCVDNIMFNYNYVSFLILCFDSFSCILTYFILCFKLHSCLSDEFNDIVLVWNKAKFMFLT